MAGDALVSWIIPFHSSLLVLVVCWFAVLDMVISSTSLFVCSIQSIDFHVFSWKRLSFLFLFVYVPSGMFYSTVLVFMICLVFYLSWNILISPPNLNCNFAGYNILGSQLSTYRNWNILFQASIVFRVTYERSEGILIFLTLYVSWCFSDNWQIISFFAFCCVDYNVL